MSIDISALTPAELESRELADAIRQAHAKARQAQNTIEQGRAEWREATIALAAALLKGRELCQDNDRAFGTWLKDNNLDEITAADREALLNMARHPAETAKALAETEKLSWQTIWRYEIMLTNDFSSASTLGPKDDDDPGVVENDSPRETAVDPAPEERGATPGSPEVAKKSGTRSRSSRSATRSAKPPQGTKSSAKSSPGASALPPIEIKQFRIEALKVAGRLTACLNDPDDDLIVKVKNCMIDIEALIERCQRNRGAR
jgi:hypothetical protein